MEIGSTSLLGSRFCSRILILPIVLLCCPLVCCCLGVAALFNNSSRHNVRPLPGIDDFPPVSTVPAIPVIPSRTPVPGSLLDPESPPLFGSATLESGFFPDPYQVDVDAGGSVDTAELSPACGYTSFHPAYLLDWQGGDDPQAFLRFFYTPDDDVVTTLLVHTPDDEWLCKQDAAHGAGTDPVLDLPSASSGEYAIWVGIQEKGTLVKGSLSITGSEDVTP